MKRLFAVVTCGLVLAGCGGGQGGAGGGSGAAGDAAAGGAAGTGAPTGSATLTGTVTFDGTPPPNPAIDMSEEAACQAKYTAAPTDPEIVVTGGKLASVFVYVKSGLPADAAYPAPTTPVVIDQTGCLYRPRVFGVMAGQPIEIRNSDPLLHNIKAVPTENRGFNISQPTEGMKTTRTFSTPEVMVPFQCNVHGWMKAFVGVMSHPFFAVSAEDGTFAIRGLPAGTYELEAWHERLGTKSLSVTVAADGSATADFAFGPPTA